MNTLELLNPQEFGLLNDKAAIIEQSFSPVISEREALNLVYDLIIKKEITPETAKEAGELRKKLVKVRTKTAEIHKAEKAFYLSGGRFVDAWKNKNTVLIEQMESTLFEIENYYVRIEERRLSELKIAREIELKTYLADGMPLPANIETLSDEMYETYLTGVKVAYDARIAEQKRIEAERIENERIENERKEAERIENERIRKENELLRLEAERIEKARKEAEAEANRKAEAARIESEKREADIIRKAEEERKRLQAEKEELERKEAARLAEEEKAKKESEKAAKKAANAPSIEKVKYAINLLSLPEISIDDADLKASYYVILQKFEGFKKWANTEIENVSK